MAVTDLDTTAREILACVCEALEEASRPVCACYSSVGPPMGVLCCSCDGEDTDYYGPTTTTGSAVVYLEQVYDAAPDTLEQVTRIHPCSRSTTAADLTILVTRCYPTIGADLQPPDTDQVDEAATLMHEDVTTVWKALTCGCSGIRLRVQGVGVNAAPEGGCAALAARVTVEVRI